MYKRTLINNDVTYDMEGPWCDIWSMGVMLIKLAIGRENRDDIQAVIILYSLYLVMHTQMPSHRGGGMQKNERIK